MSLIYSYSKQFVDDGLKLKPYPPEWQTETNEVIVDNNKFKEFFYDHFEIDPEGMISKGDFEDIIKDKLKNGNYNYKDELKKLRICYKYDSQLRKKGRKGFYVGFKEIESEGNTEMEC
jgi:hypothetical protein